MADVVDEVVDEVETSQRDLVTRISRRLANASEALTSNDGVDGDSETKQ